VPAAEGATAPETLRQKDRERPKRWKEASGPSEDPQQASPKEQAILREGGISQAPRQRGRPTIRIIRRGRPFPMSKGAMADQSIDTLRRTPLYDLHQEHGGKSSRA